MGIPMHMIIGVPKMMMMMMMMMMMLHTQYCIPHVLYTVYGRYQYDSSTWYCMPNQMR